MRSAAVCALGKFGLQCKDLRASVRGLLRASLCDEDDETRDRATLYVAILEQALEEDPYTPPKDDAEEEDYTQEAKHGENHSEAAAVLLEPMPLSFDKLERALTLYAAAPEDDAPLSFDVLPIVEDHVVQDQSAATAAQHEALAAQEVAAPVNATANLYAQPELSQFGRVFRSAPARELTESETEYVVKCVKHVLADHLILEFCILNTLDDQLLRNVTVQLESRGGEGVYEPVAEIPCANIAYGDTESSFVVLQRNDSFDVESFDCELKFTVASVDPDTREETGAPSFEEDYPLEQLDILTSDFMGRSNVLDFRKSWESICAEQPDKENEVLEKFALGYKSIPDAIQGVVSSLGMAPMDGTDVYTAGGPSNKPHMLHLAGQFVGNKMVLARAQMVMDGGKKGVVLKIAVRSDDDEGEVARLVVDCIR